MESSNKQNGFYGAMTESQNFIPSAMWNSAFSWVKSVMPMWAAETARDFLDSVAGRKLADEVIRRGGLQAIEYREWYRVLYSFTADKPGFLNSSQVSNLGRARDLTASALENLEEALKLYKLIEAQIADTEKLDRISRLLELESREIEKMLTHRHHH